MSEQRLIDAEKLIDVLDSAWWHDNADRDEVALPSVDSAPTVDPETIPIVKELRDKLARYEKAEQEGRLKILPESKSGTCGTCDHFHRIPGTRRGTCDVKDHYNDRYGKPDNHRGKYEPSQSKIACKQYIAAEAALKERDE